MATTDMPRTRLRTLLRRWGWIATAVSLLAVAAFAAVLLLTGGQAPQAAATSPAANSTEPEVLATIRVRVETWSGLIAPNHDDVLCVFGESRYEVRDGAGTVIAADRVADDGVSVGQSGWASTGVVSNEPRYSCSADWSIPTPEADVYQVTVWAGGASAGITISTLDPITLRLS